MCLIFPKRVIKTFEDAHTLGPCGNPITPGGPGGPCAPIEPAIPGSPCIREMRYLYILVLYII